MYTSHASAVAVPLPGSVLAGTSTVTYTSLRALGVPRRAIDSAVAAGQLVRLRRGTYVVATCSGAVLESARQGGRLDCLSLLVDRGVFVLEATALHVQLDPTTRTPQRGEGIVRHWRRTTAESDELTVPLVEALAQACRCQERSAAIATLDSAWHQGLVDEEGLAEVFRSLPRRLRRLRADLDRRAESGPESLMRLLLREQGWHVDVQVWIDGVGRVDLVVDGWLIIECDSEAHHSGWESGKKDRRRDLEAARLGYATLRPIAEDIFFHRGKVLESVRAAVAHRAAVTRVHNVGASRRRAAEK